MADMIDELLGLDDAALAEKLGFADKVKGFKADLTRASKLPEKARKSVNDEVARMFKPQTYVVDDIKWQIERAERKDKPCTTPASLVADCGCMDD